MVADAGYFTLVQHNNFISQENCINPLSDDDDSFLSYFSRQGLAQSRVSFEIKSRKTVIKNINFWLFDNCPGDRKPLLLAAGNIGAALTDWRFKSAS